MYQIDHAHKTDGDFFYDRDVRGEVGPLSQEPSPRLLAPRLLVLVSHGGCSCHECTFDWTENSGTLSYASNGEAPAVCAYSVYGTLYVISQESAAVTVCHNLLIILLTTNK